MRVSVHTWVHWCWHLTYIYIYIYADKYRYIYIYIEPWHTRSTMNVCGWCICISRSIFRTCALSGRPAKQPNARKGSDTCMKLCCRPSVYGYWHLYRTRLGLLRCTEHEALWIEWMSTNPHQPGALPHWHQSRCVILCLMSKTARVFTSSDGSVLCVLTRVIKPSPTWGL